MSSSSDAGRDVAVILSGWPRVSESFALNEVLALRRAGLLAAVLALKTGDGATPHPAAARARADGRGAARRHRPTSRPRPRRAVSRLDGLGVSAVHGYFAHAPAAVAAAVADKFGVPYGFSVHALDARKVSKDELGDRARGAARRGDLQRRRRRRGRGGRRRPDAGPRTASTSPPSRPAAAGRRDPVELLAVGRLVEKKGFDVLLEALSRLGPAVPAAAGRRRSAAAPAGRR